MNVEHPCRGDRTVVRQQKYEVHSPPDPTELQDAFLVQRSVQPGRHGIRTILRVPGNANGIPAQAFDPVMTALGLHVDPGTGCQAIGIHQFSRRHILDDAQRVVSVAVAFKEGRPALWGPRFRGWPTASFEKLPSMLLKRWVLLLDQCAALASKF